MSASSATETCDQIPKIERNGDIQHLERQRTAGGRQRTAGGHVDDRSQPSLPVVHRSFANPAPLGLLSFATGIFLISILGVHARGVQTPNVLVNVLLFFGGVCQFISGIMEFIAGDTISRA
jgi:succinate-acetate transporter protein